MLSEFEAGQTLEELMARYGLARSTVAAILTIQRHRRAISPQPAYRDARSRKES